MTEKDQSAAALAMIKAVYNDGSAEIGETKYVFTKMIHKNRRSVFAFYSAHAPAIQTGDFRFLDTPEFDRIEGIVNNHVTVNDSALAKIPQHWDDHAGEYLLFIQTALSVISYPFLAGGRTG